MVSLDPGISAHLATVGAECPSIRELWLVGSRANGGGSPDSDWDVLAFADEQTLAVLRAQPLLRREDLDLLIAVDGDKFESPWWRTDKPGKYKSGRLKNYDSSDGTEVVGWERTCGTWRLCMTATP